jgi:tRNA pseudouridine65 synthase
VNGAKWANRWQALPLVSGARVVAHDAGGLGAIDKPAGVRSHPNGGRPDAGALLTVSYDASEQCYRWAGGEGQPQCAWLLNRLDAGTSGVLLLALDAAVAAAVRAQFERHAVEKRYLALVFGHAQPARQTWQDRLAVERRGGVARTHDGGHLLAACDCRVLERVPGQPPVSLLELRPHTGLTHQLRVQCARRGLPVVGDATYGDFRRNRVYAGRTGIDRLMLHSWFTAVRYTLPGAAEVAFAAESPPPAEFGVLPIRTAGRR